MPPPCLHPPGRGMHKSHSLFDGTSVGRGHDRPARAATAKRKVFLKNVTTLSHNLCGAVMTAPYRQRVVSFPFPDKSNHISFCAYRLSSAIRQIGVCRCALKNTVIANQCAHWCGNPPVRGEMYRKPPRKIGIDVILGGNRYLVPWGRGIATTSLRTGLAMTGDWESAR